MYVYCVHPAMSTGSKKPAKLSKKSKNNRRSNSFCYGVFWDVRAYTVTVSYHRSTLITYDSTLEFRR